MQKEPNALHVIFGIATLGWLGYAWDAYMHMSFYGSILAVFAGATFLAFANNLAPTREASWLYGWNDDLSSHAFLRMPLYASIFIGPISRHAALAIAPEYFANERSYIAVIAVSLIIGCGMSLYIFSRVQRTKLPDK